MSAAAHPHGAPAARAMAGRRREQLKRRAQRIRRTVVSLSLGLFVAAFLTLYVQLASGHDPALSASSRHASTSTSTTSTSGTSEHAASSTSTSATEASSTTEGLSEQESSGSSEQESSSSSEESGSSPAPVTTSQS